MVSTCDYGASLNGPHVHYGSSREQRGPESPVTKEPPDSEERNRHAESRRLAPVRVSQRRLTPRNVMLELSKVRLKSSKEKVNYDIQVSLYKSLQQTLSEACRSER